jgi:hypothetical protein
MFRVRILISVRQASEDRQSFKLQKQFKFCFRHAQYPLWRALVALCRGIKAKSQKCPYARDEDKYENGTIAQPLLDLDTRCAEWSASCLSPLYLPWKEYPVPLNSKLSGLQNQSWHFGQEMYPRSLASSRNFLWYVIITEGTVRLQFHEAKAPLIWGPSNTASCCWYYLDVELETLVYM